MFGLITWFQGSFSVAAVLVFLYASQDVAENLSPQGCRMSYMNPLYIPQTQFNSTWTPLAERYSLVLYREDQWERETKCTDLRNMVAKHESLGLFCGLASMLPFVRVRADSLDLADFNEDLSAFHGPTLKAQIEYCARAISYILSLYPPNTSIIIMGHSMGGIVATSLLPSKDISSIITMSTPHTLPPARFDQRVDEIYARNREIMLHDSTPILSLCGGAMDMMIPSESCILPPLVEGLPVPYRRTVFSSALEGAWTGVGHREMVWCHQVRWRVARAAMELSMAPSLAERGLILDKWFRDGHTLPPAENTEAFESFPLSEDQSRVLSSGERLVLAQPEGSQTYLFPISKQNTTDHRFVLFVSQGSVPPVSPQKPNSLRISVARCFGLTASLDCKTLHPLVHKLIPNPIPGHTFPVPQQGTDESEGVVVFDADVIPERNSDAQWIAVNIERAAGEGWLVGGFVSADQVFDDVSMTSNVFPSLHIEYIFH
ncbi:hypothetical protein HHX47_DHR5000989 [Lentinula edodes]|nr:hypothetical protein HHX47_DHR5000989 [Lentinula edodes]